MNTKKLINSFKPRINNLLLPCALMASSFSVNATNSNYYSARRGGYGARKNNHYIVDDGINAISREMLNSKIKFDLPFEKEKLNINSDLNINNNSQCKELIIVDQNVKDFHKFYKLLQAGVEIVVLPNNDQGLESLTTILRKYHNLKAIHLFSHAKPGYLQLGQSFVGADELKQNAQFLNALNSSVQKDGDLLLYGCELAYQSDDFLEIIKSSTHLDVAASNDKTGNASFADWDLEVVKGNINTQPIDGSVALNDLTEVLQVSFSMSPPQIVNNGNYTGSANNASVHEDGGTSHTLIIDGKDSGTKANGSNVYIGGTYLVYETQVRLYLSGNVPFDPSSLKLFTSIPRTFTISSNVSGSATFSISTNSLKTIDLSALASNTTVMTITATGNFAGYIDDLVMTSIGSQANPEVNLLGKSFTIPDGDTSPSTSDDTDFGTQSVCNGTVVKTFTIQNTGTANLSVSNLILSGANANDFSITSTPNSTITPNGSSTFQVTFNPSSTGVKTATVSFNTNDSDEATYDFAIQGTGIDPEIELVGNSLTINDGNVNVSGNDNTDFGSQEVCTGTVVKTFTIKNTGSSALSISAITITGANASDFTITSNAASSIAANGSTTFEVTFNPSSSGVRNATIEVLSNDCDEATYDFAIQGTGNSTPIDVSTTITNFTISANNINPGVTYQWINCFDSTILTGETNQSYTANGVGNNSYAVIITEGSCVDTSSCEQIIINAIDNQVKENSISINPNPTNGFIVIESQLTIEKITLLDVNGKIIIEQLGNSKTLNLSNLKSGLYIIKCEFENGKGEIKYVNRY